MNKRMLWGRIALGFSVVFFIVGISAVWANEGGVPNEGQGRPDKAQWEAKKAELMKLKEKDPEKFKQIVGQRREETKERLEHLKQTDPLKYRQVMEKVQERRREYLKELKEKDPEKFKQMMQERREKMRERLETLKTTDPEKYERVQGRIEQGKKLREMRESDPQKYRKFVEEHPELKERLENKGHGGENGERLPKVNPRHPKE